jgi:protein O-GlcNAc transferase
MKRYCPMVLFGCLWFVAIFAGCSVQHENDDLDKEGERRSEGAEKPADKAAMYNAAGQALAAQGKTDRAVEHFEQALRLRPDFAEAHFNMGTVFLSQGELDKAVEHFSEALLVDGEHAQGHNNLGVALAKQGRLDDAAFHFAEALRIDPKISNAHDNLKRVIDLSRKPEAAPEKDDASGRELAE